MPPTTSAPQAVPTLREQLTREACSMARRLVTTGVRVPAGLIQAADQFESALKENRPIDMVALASTHERLARLVNPARPGTLYLLDVNYHQKGKDSSLGPVKLVRDMVKVALACVAIFIVLSVVALVDAHPGVDVFDVETGTDLFAVRGGQGAGQTDNHTLLVIKIILQRVFWLAAAGIGASFAMLFALNDQIVNRTFDPDESASYWVKFFLGLVAGFILVALIPVNAGSGAEGATNSAQALGPPTIALLGGFSASAVYRILTRMVEALESIFSGGAKEQAMSAEKAAFTRAAEEASQGKMAVAGQLVDLQQKMAAGLAPEVAAERLQRVVNALVPTAFEYTEQGARPAGTTPAPVDDPQPEPQAPPRDASADAPPQPDKVPALAVVSAPAEDVAPQEDAPAPADGSAEAEPQPAASSEAVG